MNRFNKPPAIQKKYTSQSLTKIAKEYQKAYEGIDAEAQDLATERVYEVIADYADPVLLAVEKAMALKLGRRASDHKGENFTTLRLAGREERIEPLYASNMLSEEDMTSYVTDKVTQHLQKALGNHAFAALPPLIQSEEYLTGRRTEAGTIQETLDKQITKAFKPLQKDQVRKVMMQEMDGIIANAFSRQFTEITEGKDQAKSASATQRGGNKR